MKYFQKLLSGLLSAMLFFGCSTEAELPTVFTDSITDIDSSSAQVNATITDDGGAPVDSRGVCYGLNPEPSSATGSCITNERGTGAYSTALDNLVTNATYYTRAFATNSAGTAYGNTLVFNVGGAILTGPVSIVSSTLVTCIGTVNLANETISSKGVCWANSPEPTIDDFLTENGADNGSFTANLTGLILGESYYVRTYAVIDGNVRYGNEIEFLMPGFLENTGLDYSISLNSAEVAILVSSGMVSKLINPSITFAAVNSNPVQFNEVQISSGSMTFSFISDFQHDLELSVNIPELKLNGIPFNHVFNIDYAGQIVSANLDTLLAGYVVDLGSGTNSNMITVNYHVNFALGAGAIPTTINSVSIEHRFIDMIVIPL
jgi:hypothetical protein